MIDRIGAAVSDVAKSKAFFLLALAPLGYKLVRDLGNAAGMGAEGHLDFWLRQAPGVGKNHIAFASPDRATVKAFYDAAITAGGKDNGPPGLRPQYHRDYYAAFVFDPDGNNIEAVCRKAE
jgi:catechol 2,3-dioxygenase-like lactoylglutathione lyase family enzyme